MSAPGWQQGGGFGGRVQRKERLAQKEENERSASRRRSLTGMGEPGRADGQGLAVKNSRPHAAPAACHQHAASEECSALEALVPVEHPVLKALFP